jgi:cyanate permease
MQQNSLWKLVLLIGVLLIFAAIGVAHILKPDWFLKRSGVRKGGAMLTEWTRLQFQIVGAIFAAFAVFLLYILLSDYFSH